MNPITEVRRSPERHAGISNAVRRFKLQGKYSTSRLHDIVPEWLRVLVPESAILLPVFCATTCIDRMRPMDHSSLARQVQKTVPGLVRFPPLPELIAFPHVCHDLDLSLQSKISTIPWCIYTSFPLRPLPVNIPHLVYSFYPSQLYHQHGLRQLRPQLHGPHQYAQPK